MARAGQWKDRQIGPRCVSIHQPSSDKIYTYPRSLTCISSSLSNRAFVPSFSLNTKQIPVEI